MAIRGVAYPHKSFASTLINEHLWRRIFRRDALIYAVLTILVSRTMLFGSISPFGAAFLAAGLVYLRQQALVAVLLSILLATWYQGYAAGLAVFIFSVVQIVIIERYHIRDIENDSLKLGLSVAISSVLIHGFGLLGETVTLYAVIVLMLTALMSGVLTGVFWQALQLVFKSEKTDSLTNEELLTVSFLAAVILAGCGGIYVYGYSVQKLLVAVSIMIVAMSGGAGLGAAAGIVTGIVTAISGFASPAYIGVLGLAGLLAGFFRDYGRLGVVLGYVIGYLALGLYIDVGGERDQVLVMLFAGILFLIIPRRFISEVWGAVNRESEEDLPFWQPKRKEEFVGIDDRLNNFSAVFAELAKAFGQVAPSVPSEERNLAMLVNSVAERTCKDCSSFNYCWETEFFNTYQRVVDLVTIVEMKGSGVPYGLKSKCMRSGELVDSVKRALEIYETNDYWSRQLQESRNLVALQLEGVSQMMADLVKDYKKGGSPRIYGERMLDYRVGRASISKEGELTSGDSSLYRESQQRLVVALADGMGAGNRAAMESQTTVELLWQLLDAGFPEDLAIKTTNSILFLRSQEEIFSTVDLVVVDLCQGQTNFIKVGAAPSYLKRGRSVSLIKAQSLPIGIVHNIDIHAQKIRIKPGDLLIMITDGILDARERNSQVDWLHRFLVETPYNDPQELATAILEKAIEYNRGQSYDDATVLVIKALSKPKPVKSRF